MTSSRLAVALAATLSATHALAAPPDYATWLGGTSNEWGFAAATAPDGTLVVAGRTAGNTFPFTPGAPIAPVATFNGQPFVARIDPNTAGPAGLLFADYLGGTNGNLGGEARAVAVDAAGNVYVVGWTQHLTMPVVGGFAAAPSDLNNGFLVKLSPDGKTILYSTYIGGSHNVDEMNAIAVDGSGVATIAGHSASYDFPVKAGFAGAPQNGLFDAVVLRVDTTKTGAASLLWSTAYGGTGDDYARGVALGPNGLVYVTGHSQSWFVKIPTTANALQANSGGGDDAFLAVFDPSAVGAAQLVYASYFGGNYSDFAYAVGVGPGGRAYLTGTTQSPAFPVTAGAWDTTLDATFGAGTRSDVFLTAIDPFAAGGPQSLLWSTFLGGQQNEIAYDLEVDGLGRPVIAGETGSPDFPISACSAPKDSSVSAFATRFSATGVRELGLVFGGNNVDRAAGLGLLPAGRMVLFGTSVSTTLPVTANAVQPARAGGDDTFTAVLWDCQTCPPGQMIGPDGICHPCPAGSASPDGVACRPCADGTVAPDPGADLCEPCDCGTESSADATTCDPCFGGTASVDGTFCAPCAAGEVSSDLACGCQACPPGTVPDADQTACVAQCAPGQLASLETPGLSPAFSPGLMTYTIPSGISQSSWVKATPCDPSNTLYVGGMVTPSGALRGVWTGNGQVSVSLYSGWTHLATYTLVVDPNLPEPPFTLGVASIDAADLTPAFDQTVVDYTIKGSPGDLVTVTATLAAPATQLFVEGMAATSGQPLTVWAPVGTVVDVSAYAGWTPVGHYRLTVVP